MSWLIKAVWGMVLAGVSLAGMAEAQAITAQSAVSPGIENVGPDETEAPKTPASVQPVGATDEIADPVVDPASLLPDLPSLKPAKATLIGGTVAKLDRVRDQITVQVFGGGKMKISFDTRSHIYDNDGAAATTSDLRPGDRIYIDTVLDGSTVFAKNIRRKTAGSAGESQGIVLSYRSDKGELVVRDRLSPKPLKVHLNSQTKIVHGDRPVTAGELSPGTLVALKFGAQQDGSDVAREVSVLAVPGASFTFAGTVTAVDLRLGILVLSSSTDHKTYEISIDSLGILPVDDLRPGSDVTVLSRYDGNRYVARTITLNSTTPR
jgi:hypothetical protein